MFKEGEPVILVKDIDDEYKAGTTGFVYDVSPTCVYVKTDKDFVASPHDMWMSTRSVADQIGDLRCLLADAFKRIENLENRLDDDGFGYRSGYRR